MTDAREKRVAKARYELLRDDKGVGFDALSWSGDVSDLTLRELRQRLQATALGVAACHVEAVLDGDRIVWRPATPAEVAARLGGSVELHLATLQRLSAVEDGSGSGSAVGKSA